MELFCSLTNVFGAGQFRWMRPIPITAFSSSASGQSGDDFKGRCMRNPLGRNEAMKYASGQISPVFVRRLIRGDTVAARLVSP